MNGGHIISFIVLRHWNVGKEKQFILFELELNRIFVYNLRLLFSSGKIKLIYIV